MQGKIVKPKQVAPHIGFNFFPPADHITHVINALVVFAGGF